MLLAFVKELLAGVTAAPLRVHGAAKLGQLTERGPLQVQAGQAMAFVLPLGLSGGQETAATGLFRQAVDRMVGVVLGLKNLSDTTGEAGLIELEPLVDEVIAQIVGRAPDGAIGTLRLVKGELVSITAGTIQFQIDFALSDQLRITT